MQGASWIGEYDTHNTVGLGYEAGVVARPHPRACGVAAPEAELPVRVARRRRPAVPPVNGIECKAREYDAASAYGYTTMYECTDREDDAASMYGYIARGIF